ncbi:MAG: 3-oxoacyl-[acyl-carrier protein] reductase [Microbacteriaceae bacterium]|nr:3-oxoacyl-[acyl-carrier protein] reductase [Microbacteriaceae bacterium]
MTNQRPVALVTGVGRRVGIAYGIAGRLARDGWDIAFGHSAAYDERVNALPRAAPDVQEIERELRGLGARTVAVDVDLAAVDAAAELFDAAETLGPVRAIVLSHAESVNAGILTTTVESFDRHLAVNARGSWLLVREFARRFDNGGSGSDGLVGDGLLGNGGRIVALTSDAIHDEVAYGASKGALDRVIFAAARELAPLGVTANLVNPGPVDTGWMADEVREALREATPAGRLGTPRDTAALVSFLLSADGEWITGQLIKSDGGFGAP